MIGVAARLRNLLRTEDTVCRLGGDEFVVLLPGAGEAGALHVTDKLLSAFRQPFVVARHSLHATLSIGIALYPQDGANFDELMKNADTAMYQAKQEGRNHRVFYASEMNVAGVERLVLETELRQRLLNDYGENVFVSAHTKEGLEELRQRMTRLIKESYVVRYPHQVKGW